MNRERGVVAVVVPIILGAVMLSGLLIGLIVGHGKMDWGQVANQFERQKAITMAYDKAAHQAHDEGKITDEQFRSAVALYNKYATLHNLTMESLTLAQQTKQTPPNLDDMEKRLSSMAQELYTFLKVIGVY